MVGLAWFWVACACAASAVHGKAPQAPVSALQELLHQPVGPHVADAFHWPQAYLALGRAAEAADLRNFLLQAWLTELETGQPTPSLTVDAATSLGRDWSSHRLSREGSRSWQSVASRWLQPGLATTAVPVPDDIDNIAADLTPEAPGVWAYRQRDGALRGLFVQLTLTNKAQQPLVVDEFKLVMGDSTADRPQARLLCLPPHTPTRAALEPGASKPYLCRLPTQPVLNKGQTLGNWVEAARQPGALQLLFHEFDFENGQTLVADTLALRHRAELNGFMARHGLCLPYATCSKPVPTATPASALSVPEKSHDKRPADWMEWRDALLFGAELLGVIAVYVAVYRVAGPVVSVGLLFVISAFFCWRFAHDMLNAGWADNWGGIVAIPFAGVAFGAPFFIADMAWSVHKRSEANEDDCERKVTVFHYIAGFFKTVFSVLFRR